MKKLLVLSLVVIFSISCNRERIGYVVPVVNPTGTYDNRSVGVSAKDFLTSARYKAINLEICYVKNHELPEDVVSGAVAFLNKYCYKPGGVNVSFKETPLLGAKFDVDGLTAIEKQYRTKFEKPGKDNEDTLGLYVLVTEGSFAENGVLGVAYKNSSLALFDGIISENSGGIAQPDRTTLLSIVMQHELGHILGLVNSGTPLQSGHHDAAHGKHCTNNECLMYYKMQTTDILSLITGNTIPSLDADCQTDLRANGGR